MGKKDKEQKEKPLDKMTAKELREAALKIEGVVGVHGMNKPELVAVIKQARGIVDTVAKKSSDVSVREIKKKIHSLKALKTEAKAADDKSKAKVLRRRINKLKKKTRRAA
jgi:hypothetical protein